MQAIKGGWVGKPLALATYNDSGSRKTRIRRSKEERKTMVETFIKKYQKSNNGNFPSLNLTHKEVGGSFYTVREIVREIIQENKVLGPAKLPPEEQDIQFVEQYPLGSISTEPQSFSLSGETLVMSTFASIDYMDKSEESDCDSNGRIEQSDESYIITSESNQTNKDDISYSTGINGFDHGILNEQLVCDYETTEENEFSGKPDLLDDLSPNLQITNSQVLHSTKIISEHVSESFIGGAEACYPTFRKDETYEELICTESAVRGNLDVEGGLNELEASKAGIHDKMTELMVEKFPLRHTSTNIDNLDSGSTETATVAKTLKETEHEQDIITSSKKASQLVSEPVDVIIADATSEKSSKPLHEKAELKAGEALLELKATADDVVAKASSSLNGTVTASSPMLNETLGSSSNKCSSNKPASDELIDVKGKATIQHGSRQQKGGNPPLDRIHLGTWEGASAKSKEHETNPLLAILKSCITAFVKFWTEE